MPPKLRQFDVIVLGAGAAGLMCAATAGQRGRRVALLEHGGQAGRKILISGGGRCNFTNLHCGPQNFISENRHFAKSALAGYGPQDFLSLVDRYGIRWHEKTLGQLFCDGSARAILDMLLAECALGGVELVLNARDIAVERESAGFSHTITSPGARSVARATRCHRPRGASVGIPWRNATNSAERGRREVVALTAASASGAARESA